MAMVAEVADAIAAVILLPVISPPPTQKPIRIVAAIPIAIGGMKKIAFRFIAILCAATTSAPNRPINKVVKEKSPISAKIVVPIGMPMISNGRIICQFGQENLSRQPVILNL